MSQELERKLTELFLDYAAPDSEEDTTNLAERLHSGISIYDLGYDSADVLDYHQFIERQIEYLGGEVDMSILDGCWDQGIIARIAEVVGNSSYAPILLNYQSENTPPKIF